MCLLLLLLLRVPRQRRRGRGAREGKIGADRSQAFADSGERVQGVAERRVALLPAGQHAEHGVQRAGVHDDWRGCSVSVVRCVCVDGVGVQSIFKYVETATKFKNAPRRRRRSPRRRLAVPALDGPAQALQPFRGHKRGWRGGLLCRGRRQEVGLLRLQRLAHGDAEGGVEVALVAGLGDG